MSRAIPGRLGENLRHVLVEPDALAMLEVGIGDSVAVDIGDETIPGFVVERALVHLTDEPSRGMVARPVRVRLPRAARSS